MKNDYITIRILKKNYDEIKKMQNDLYEKESINYSLSLLVNKLVKNYNTMPKNKMYNND